MHTIYLELAQKRISTIIGGPSAHILRERSYRICREAGRRGSCPFCHMRLSCLDVVVDVKCDWETLQLAISVSLTFGNSAAKQGVNTRRWHDYSVSHVDDALDPESL